MSDRYELSSDNKGAADLALDFPKLSLKKGEIARLAVFGMTEKDGKKELALPQPEGGYFWSIRKADGSFGGAFECLAPEEVKRADEFDGEACFHCKARLEGAPDTIIEDRKRRFVMPVIRYRTLPGKSTLTTPFGVECVAWVFSDRYFNTLVDEHEKWGSSGGLLGHDISLLCEVEQYQNYKVSVEPEAAYRKDQDLMRLVFGTYAAGVELAPSLRRKLGATISNDQMQSKITEALRIAGMIESGATQVIPPESMAAIEGLADDLFGSLGALPDSQATAIPDIEVAVDAAPLAPAPEVPAPVDAPLAPVPVVPETAESEEVDFDAFFK